LRRKSANPKAGGNYLMEASGHDVLIVARELRVARDRARRREIEVALEA
jgi:hypothetical protein